MRNQVIRSKDFSRRAFLFGGIQAGMLSALGARMYYLQVTQADEFKTKADGNRIRLFPVMPPRGKLFDRNGNVLAEGFLRYQSYYEPPTGKKREDEILRVINQLQDVLEIDSEDYQELYTEAMDAGFQQKVLVSDYLTWGDVAKLEVNTPQLPGVTIEVPEIRNYPYGSFMANIIGYVQAPNVKDLERNPHYKKLAGIPEFKIGKTGLEKSQEDKLRGEAGVRHAEVDAYGRFVRDLKTDPGKAGEDLTLTIDIELQKYVIQTLAGKGGLQTEGATATVIDIDTGDVLSMASVPMYDPNRFVRGIDQAYWKSLIEDEDRPLTNKAIASQYPPGSTFKAVVALALLQHGIVNTETEVYCPGYHDFGGRRFHCWDHRGHGNVNIEKALGVSCNVFFFTMCKKLGVDNIAEFAQYFGLGEKTGIELPGEKAGLVPTKAWKEMKLSKPWYIGETLNTSIGQGYNLATPLQLAVMCARMASGGKEVKPRLIKPSTPDQYETVMMPGGESLLLPKKQEPFQQIEGVSRRHLQTVLRGMNLVVNDKVGSVYKNRIRDESMAFAGKTGTSQVVNRTFLKTPKDAAQRYHAWFIGYAPVYDPKYAVSVFVEHGGYGSAVAAPIARDILLKVQQLKSGE